MRKLVPFIFFFFGCWPVISQITNNYYFRENSNTIIDTLEKVAIIPGWVHLKPDIYSNVPEKLKIAEEEASLFFQDLLYSSLLMTNSTQLRDIYKINSILIDHTQEISGIGLNFSPPELCRLLEVDAVLLTFVSYDKTFVLNNPEVVNLFQQVQWNKPVKRKNVVMGLFYKDGTPLWAASFETGGIDGTVRQENQQFPITLYGYFGAKK